MKSLVKVSILMLASLFLMSCSTDPEVEAVAETPKNGPAGDKGMCVAKKAKGDMTAEEWDSYYAFLVDESIGMFEMEGDSMEKHIKAMVMCDVDM